jgi:hypothetical protein
LCCWCELAARTSGSLLSLPEEDGVFTNYHPLKPKRAGPQACSSVFFKNNLKA